MPLVCRYKPNRSKPRLFGLKDLERISCAVFENGQGTPDEIREACEKCLPPREQEECQEERELIEQVAPLLFAGLATLAMFIPIARVFAVIRRVALIAWAAISPFVAGIPWIGRVVTKVPQVGAIPAASAEAEFIAAQAALSPQYVAAIASTAKILNRLQKQVETTGPLLFLLALAGITVEQISDDEEEA